MDHTDKAMEGETPKRGSKRVLFSGVGGCIGTAILDRLDRDGWDVAAFSHVDADRQSIVVDFEDDEAIAAAVAAAGGSYTAIVLSHGILEPGPWEDISPGDWRRLLNVNLNSIYAILHAALPRVLNEGSIVVVSSTAAFDHSPVGGPHYTASKWALNGLVRHLASELGPSGIRINAVCPSLVDSPMGRALLTEQQYLDAFRDIPLRRPARAEEIAAAVMYLLSRESSYITGGLIPVSGGYQ